MATRYGNQNPTFECVGEYDHTRGEEAASMFESYGLFLMPCQRRELDLYMAYNDDGRASCKSICVSKPRQNGKSFAARLYSIWSSVVEGKSVLYTAHHGVTTRDMFSRTRDFVEGTPDFAHELVKNGVKNSQGSESINFRNGGKIEFNTRTASVSRGKSYDIIVIDEAQMLDEFELGALKPTTLATDSGDPQMIYLGTPPDVKSKGTVFAELHRKAHRGELHGAWWIEWAADSIGDVMDEERWYRCCPAMGYRIRRDVMLDAAETTAPDTFAREYLGWWGNDYGSNSCVISPVEWNACKTDNPPESGLMTCGVKFAPDGSRASLAVCLRPLDSGSSAAYVEVVDVRSLEHGVGWIEKWIIKRADKIASVAIDGRFGASALYQRLIDSGMKKQAVVTATTRDAAGANSMFLDAVRSCSVTHYGQEELDDSATLTNRRKLGSDGFGFEDTEQADATLVESCALAYWQSRTTKRRPGRRAVVY